MGREYNVEGDFSSASYFFGAAAVTGGRIKVKNLNLSSVQGDAKFLEVLEKMGCRVDRGEDYVGLDATDVELEGVEVDMNLMPDTVQTLAVIALFAKGKTVIKNVANLRIKETDRLTALANELKKLGAEVIEEEDSLTVIPKENYNGVEIETYEDHRMAMSFSLAGLKIEGIKIAGDDCVSKSFPDYWDRFEELSK